MPLKKRVEVGERVTPARDHLHPSLPGHLVDLCIPDLRVRLRIDLVGEPLGVPSAYGTRQLDLGVAA